jgi:hypothetical protein
LRVPGPSRASVPPLLLPRFLERENEQAAGPAAHTESSMSVAAIVATLSCEGPLRRTASGGSRDFVQQMQEQPGSKRRTWAVLHYDLAGTNDLEFTKEAVRRRPDDRL